MTRPLVFATRNRGKVLELRALLPGVDVVTVAEAEVRLGRSLPEVDETGATFEANADLKARAIAHATGWPALADDSGLEVDALGGAPGVRSARYAADLGAQPADLPHDVANNAALLRALAGVPAPARTARFRCHLTLRDPAGALGPGGRLDADGVCEGVILEAPRGDGGFGYDPLFLIPELGGTFAELDLAAKNQRSHRAAAMRAMAPAALAYLAT
jgi:XTP/dITP diphosphohydrolase